MGLVCCTPGLRPVQVDANVHARSINARGHGVWRLLTSRSKAFKVAERPEFSGKFVQCAKQAFCLFVSTRAPHRTISKTFYLPPLLPPPPQKRSHIIPTGGRGEPLAAELQPLPRRAGPFMLNWMSTTTSRTLLSLVVHTNPFLTFAILVYSAGLTSSWELYSWRSVKALFNGSK